MGACMAMSPWVTGAAGAGRCGRGDLSGGFTGSVASRCEGRSTAGPGAPAPKQQHGDWGELLSAIQVLCSNMHASWVGPRRQTAQPAATPSEGGEQIVSGGE